MKIVKICPKSPRFTVLAKSDWLPNPMESLRNCEMPKYTCNNDCFHTTAKCVILILIRNAHIELKFERR